MQYESLNLLEFQKRYDSEEACLEALFAMRWPRGFICKHCGHNDGYRLSARRTVQCASCRRQSSITSGTLFNRTKIPLRKWFWLIFLMSQDKGGISTVMAAELLGMHYTTVWTMMHKVREAMTLKMQNDRLSGSVEVDDAFFGAKGRNKRGRSRGNKKQVCVMVERTSTGAGDAALVVMHDMSGSEFRRAVYGRVEEMTHIRTDGYSYNHMLIGLAGELNMEKVQKPYSEDGPLKNVDRVISLAKRFLLGTYHQYCARAHLQRFLNEYAFRFNRRYKWNQLASRVLSACALCPPVQYAVLS